LNARERAVLDGLLQFDHPGVEALREHAATARVRRSCACGCPSIGFERDDTDAVDERPWLWPASGWRKQGPVEVILFVRDGSLAEMELVTYDGETPGEWPDASEFTFSAGSWLS
jgi:hypothetical protein